MTEDVQAGVCRSCGKAVLWVKTAATGSLIPLDAVPNPEGNMVLKDGRAHQVPKGLFDEQAPEGERFMPHHATCPQGRAWRKK